MDQVRKTIAIPVWIGKAKAADIETIYVPSVDVPQGSWSIVLRLTPIDNALLVLEGSPYTIANVVIAPPNEKIQVETRAIPGGQGYQIFVTNNLPSYKDGRRQAPVPWAYKIDVKNTKTGFHHLYDPVVIAQPDPIYP